MTLVEHFTETGRNEGELKSRKEASLDNARQMLQDDMFIELITKYTGLSREEIEALRE